MLSGLVATPSQPATPPQRTARGATAGALDLDFKSLAASPRKSSVGVEISPLVCGLMVEGLHAAARPPGFGAQKMQTRLNKQQCCTGASATAVLKRPSGTTTGRLARKRRRHKAHTATTTRPLKKKQRKQSAAKSTAGTTAAANQAADAAAAAPAADVAAQDAVADPGAEDAKADTAQGTNTPESPAAKARTTAPRRLTLMLYKHTGAVAVREIGGRQLLQVRLAGADGAAIRRIAESARDLLAQGHSLELVKARVQAEKQALLQGEDVD